MSVGLSNLVSYYNIVYDQAISPSGSHLAACDSYGKISIFSFSTALNSTSGKNDRIASKTVKGHEGAVYCLQEADNLLVSGGEDGINVWNWSHLLNMSKEVRPVKTFKPPYLKSRVPETNGMAYDSKTNTLYTGGGDNLIHAWDLQTSKIKASYSGHTKYVHCVCMRTGSSHFLSGSEDGTVRIWDPAVPGGNGHVLKPTKTSSSDWVGCVAVDDSGDWLVCAGSMGPTFYHLTSAASATKTTTVESPAGSVTQSVLFVNDRILSAGSGGEVRHWSINGDSLTSVPSDLTHIFSLKYNQKNRKNEVLTAAGDSSNINVFMNLGYTAFSLTVPN